MIKIELDKNLRAEIEKTHWMWFLYRLSQKCTWNGYKGKNYLQFIFDHVELLTSQEKQALNKNQQMLEKYKRLRLLVIGNQEKPPKTLSGEEIDFSFFIKLNGLKINPKVRRNPKDTEEQYKQKKEQQDNHLKEVFGYEDFRDSSDDKPQWYKRFKKRNGDKDWNSKVLCEKLKIDVCPYCNRQYTYTYEKGDSKKSIAEIDHFKPESLYPYLSCSLYNFIPACHLCNFIKLNQIDDIVYPYTECFGDDAKFRIERDDSQEMKIPIDVENAKVKVSIAVNEDSLIKEKIKNSKKIFCLDGIYSKHQLDIGDLLLRYNEYGKMKMKEIARVMNLPEATVRKMVLGLPLQVGERKEYVLRKFKNDIIDQLDQKSKEIRQ